MNEVRIRKENQVYTAEEKRALALHNYEQKQEREAKLMESFQTMLREQREAAAAQQAQQQAQQQP
jgi:hypothetical protein